jgi:hypothetical protein
MSRREANRFEEALQMEAQGRAVDERLAPLVMVARKASILSEPPPAPPHRLSPGRQRFLAEAARLRNPGTNPRKVRIRMATIPSTILTALMLVFGLLFSAGQVTAASLPGDPLYGIKLMAEEVRMATVAAPVSKAELARARAEERLDEVVLLLESGEVVNEATSLRAQEQLRAALQTAAQLHLRQATRALQRLEQGIQQRQRIMERLADGEPDTPLQILLREMERVRLHACDGQENPDRLREWLRLRDGPPPPEEGGEPGVLPVPEDDGAGAQPDPDPAPAPGGNGYADPDPDPAPVPGGDGDPNPQPDPGPKPGGNGNADPEPNPAPGPGGSGDPDPDPNPAPNPGGNGNPDPDPEPAPGPGGNGNPDPDPEPAPDPGGNGSPDPDPEPAPDPGGNGNPDPNPEPAPDPGGSGNPDPNPEPAPDPGGNGSGGGGKP